jgi:hypothetical protein
VGGATYSTVEPLFEWGEDLRLRLKGKPEAVSAREVIRPLGVRGKIRGFRGVESPLIGRVEELSAIKDVLKTAVSGLGTALFIVGDPGVGKRQAAEGVSSPLRECRPESG